MAFVAAVFVAVSLAALFAAGESCNNIASTTRTAACSQTGKWENLCLQTLQNAPDSAELTVYALIAARLAKLKYEGTWTDFDSLLGGANLPAGERAAVSHCRQKYGEARSLMAGVDEQLFACSFAQVRQELFDAQVAVGSCRDGLLTSYQSLPAFAEISADYDHTMVAYLLGALIVGK